MRSDGASTKLCFVVGPIGKAGSKARIHADRLLAKIIRPVMSKFPEFAVKRADEDARPGLIDIHMIDDLLDAELVIADLSRSNPNAFYEIGIRHVAQRPIIHMQLASEKIPFDIAGYRAIKFSLTKVQSARNGLSRAVEAVLAPGYKVENPFTRKRRRPLEGEELDLFNSVLGRKRR